MQQGAYILAIDDDPDMQDAFKMILEPVGYTVKCCSSGPEGLASARRKKPDLILLDIMLSSPSEGFHLAYEMREDENLKDVPIIMVSSIGQTMGMDYAKELGSDYIKADMFLDKPIQASVLREAVEKTLCSAARK